MTDETQPTEHAAEHNEQPKRRPRTKKPQEHAEPHGNGHAEPHQAEQHPAHAERVDHPDKNGEHQAWVDRANVITDKAAKMKFHFDYKGHLAVIEFDDKPCDDVRRTLKDNNFRWNSHEKTWENGIRFASREQERQAAIATFNGVAEMRHEEMGTGKQR